MTQSRGIRKHFKEDELIGNKYGKLTVLREATGLPMGRRRTMVCKCDCGAEKEVALSNLLSGRTKSCGCSRPQFKRKHKVKAGDTYGRLTVVRERKEKVGVNPQKRAVIVTCSCTPDHEFWVLMDNLRHGTVKSCGCLRNEYYDSLRSHALDEATEIAQTTGQYDTTPEEDIDE